MEIEGIRGKESPDGGFVVLDTQARSEAGGGSGVVNTRRMAMDYIRRGQSCLKESKDVFEEGDYPMAIRKAQECVELSLKAALRAISVEYPREHDVGRALELVKGRVPDWFSLQISEFMKISRDLAKKRGPAFYGFETELKPASDIFTRGGC